MSDPIRADGEGTEPLSPTAHPTPHRGAPPVDPLAETAIARRPSRPTGRMARIEVEPTLEERLAGQISTVREVTSQVALGSTSDEVAGLLVYTVQAAFGGIWTALFRDTPSGGFVRRMIAGDGAQDLPEQVHGEEAADLHRMGNSATLRAPDQTGIGVFSGAALAAPIDNGNDRLGWLVLGARPTGPAFDRYDAELLALLSQVVAPRLAYADAMAEYRRSALVDELTGLGNKRACEERAEEELARSNRSGQPLALIICDVDHFRAFNEERGRLDGDRVLRAVSDAIRSSTRLSDSAFRTAGDEFAALVTHTDTQGASIVAERLRRFVETRVSTMVNYAVTVSVGVGALKEGVHTPVSLAALALFKKADQALHRAKRSGGNCTIVG